MMPCGNKKSRRAISPVVAVIMLVGIAVGAAALAYAWYTTTQKSLGEEAAASGAQLGKATGYNLQIVSAVNGSQVNVTVRNIGSGTIDSVSLFVGGENKTSISSLSQGASDTANVTTTGGLSEGTVIEAIGNPGGYDRAVVR